MDWNVSKEMVDELLAAGVPGLTTRLQAMLVFQHCTVHSLSLFDFLAQWKIEGLRLVPSVDPPNVRELPAVSLGDQIATVVFAIESAGSLPAAAAFVEDEFPSSEFAHAGWRDETLSANRLEKLRLHINEVGDFASRGFKSSDS